MPEFLCELQRSEPDLLAELVRMFLGDGAAHLDRLREQVTQEDSKAMVGTQHAFKGSALQIGAMRVAAILIDMEEKLAKGGIEAVKELLALLSASLQEVCLEMEELISGRPAAKEDAPS
jgi:two-component system sensor histidine kinase RpfC